ncbi:MAG: hypothetical protein HC836_43900 [Richelia sp. RM2_1_2]|nr:hypothetical protein [Richelia sp. RM2_1_2]
MKQKKNLEERLVKSNKENNMAERKISASTIFVAIGLFLLATIPFYFLVINNQKIEVSIKSADESVKELSLQNEDLLRGRVADKDSADQYKHDVEITLHKKDSTITVLEKKINKREVENRELKQEIDSIKILLKNVKWSDIQPVGDKDKKENK